MITKQTIKKVTGLVLAITLSMSFTNTFAASLGNFATTKTYEDFNDVSKTEWYYQDVKRSYETGLFFGRDNSIFAPDGNLTLAEAITLVARIHHIYNGGDGSVSDEVTPDWYGKYIDYAVDNNIIFDGEFTNYLRNATRAELAHLFNNSLGSNEFNAINSINKLPDVTSNLKYSNDIFVLYNAGILRGSDDYGTFYPTTDIKRSEVAAIINRVVNKDDRLIFTLAKPEASIPSYYTAEQKKTVEDIRTVYSRNLETYKALKSMYEGEELSDFEKDYDQMLNDPFSSPELTEYFNRYMKTGDIDFLASDCIAWLMNGGDDGTVNSVLH